MTKDLKTLFEEMADEAYKDSVIAGGGRTTQGMYHMGKADAFKTAALLVGATPEARQRWEDLVFVSWSALPGDPPRKP